MKLRKIQISVVSFSMLLLFACGGNTQKQVENVYENDDLYTDEFKLEDSTGSDFTGEPYPMSVDRSFDDFVFAFTANKEFQLQRTKLPLPVMEDGVEVSTVNKEQWAPDSLFIDRYFYTLLFDEEEDMELISDPELLEARVEWIYLDNNNTKSYNFKRENDIWMLNSISRGHLEEYDNEEFIRFYSKFATDTIFQVSRLVMPLEYATVDPEDDFEILETVIDANSWTSLKPVLPTSKLVNINYGQRNDAKSKTKILAVKGISNGFSNVFFFRLNAKGKWELYKFEDIGV